MAYKEIHIMKKNAIIRGVLAVMLIMSSARVFAQKNVDVTLFTDNIGNIFGTDESVVATISIENSDTVSKDIDIVWQAKKQDNNAVTDSGTERITIDGNSAKKVTIDIDCDLYGLYNLQTTTSWAGGESSESLKFSKVMSSDSGERNKDFGFASHLWRYGRHTESVELMQKAGAGGWSDGITWVKAEVREGVFVLNSANVEALEASDSNTENMMVLGFGNPAHITRYDASGNKVAVTDVYPPITEEELKAFGDYCTYIAEKTKGYVNRFQIWNEWELEGFNPEKLDASYYVKILKTAYQAIKSVNKKAEVVGMGGAIITSTGDFDKAVLDAGGLEYMDALSIHVYDYHRMSYFPNKRVIEDVQERIDLYKSYMTDKILPIYISETGWSTTSTAEAFGASTYSEKDQAENLVKSFVTMKAFDLGDKMYWYDFQDDGEDESERENRFGVVTSRYNEEGELLAKPSYLAAAAMNKIMSGGIRNVENDKFQTYSETEKMWSIWGDYKRIDSYVVGIYSFERVNQKSEFGKNVSVLWSRKQKQFKISTGTKSIDRYDIYGNCETLYSENGIYDISLNNELIYLSGDFEFFNINKQSVKIEEVSYDAVKNQMTVKGSTDGMSSFYIELCENNEVVQKELCGVKKDGSFERIISVAKNGTYTLNAGKDDISNYAKWETPIVVEKTKTEDMSSHLGGVVVSGNKNDIKITGELFNISKDEAVSVIAVPSGKTFSPDNIIYLNQVKPSEDGKFTVEMSIPQNVKVLDIYVGASYADKATLEYSYDVCRVVSFELEELDGNVVVSAVVENLTDSNEEHTIVVAQYGDNNQLVKAVCQSYEVKPDLEERQTLTFRIPKDSLAKTGKAFIWDSLSKLTPLFRNAEIEF